MAKKSVKSVPANTGALTLEEFQKLSPEEQATRFAELQNNSAKLATAEKQAGKLPMLTDVPADEENEIEAGDYQWTAPTFTWDDNRVIKVSELMAEAESKEKKVAEKAELIIAQLLQRKSGLLVFIKNEEE